MTEIHNGLHKVSREVRPKILRLAKDKKLIDTCFNEFQKIVYPGAPADQVDQLRVAFIAGAAEFYAVMMYGADMASDEATDSDLELMNGVSDEISEFHERVIAATSPRGGA